MYKQVYSIIRQIESNIGEITEMRASASIICYFFA